MSEIQEIEQAIRQLSDLQLAEFRRWFAEFDSESWDKQIKADAAAGKLDNLAKEAIEEYQTGKTREL